MAQRGSEYYYLVLIILYISISYIITLTFFEHFEHFESNIDRASLSVRLELEIFDRAVTSVRLGPSNIDSCSTRILEQEIPVRLEPSRVERVEHSNMFVRRAISDSNKRQSHGRITFKLDCPVCPQESVVTSSTSTCSRNPKKRIGSIECSVRLVTAGLSRMISIPCKIPRMKTKGMIRMRASSPCRCRRRLKMRLCSRWGLSTFMSDEAIDAGHQSEFFDA